MKFQKYPDDLFSAIAFKSDVTGKPVEMNPGMRNVYLYMTLKWIFHLQNGRAYYESYDTIGSRCGVNGRTVMRIVTILEEHGVMKIERQRGRGVTKNVYRDIKKLDLIHDKVVDKEPEPATIEPTNEEIPEWVNEMMEEWV